MTLLQLLYQYRSDLKHPVTDSGSLARRLDAIDKAIKELET